MERGSDLPGDKVFAQNHSRHKLLRVLHGVLTAREAEGVLRRGRARGSPGALLGTPAGSFLVTGGPLGSGAACSLPRPAGSGRLCWGQTPGCAWPLTEAPPNFLPPFPLARPFPVPL